jgi:transcriptional regulator with XRE-family HTH domain
LLLTNKTLGNNIAYYRKKRKLYQAKLAAIVGMEDNHLSCIEIGLKYPRINLIARLAVGLGVSIDELVEVR